MQGQEQWLSPPYSSQDEEVLQVANCCAMCAVASFTLSYKSKERNCLSHGQVVLLSVFPDSTKGKKSGIGWKMYNIQIYLT